jgi:hypothetical protein
MSIHNFKQEQQSWPSFLVIGHPGADMAMDGMMRWREASAWYRLG